MDTPDSKNWQFAGHLPGQGIRQLELDDRLLLVIELENDLLVIDAACSACGQILEGNSSGSLNLICPACGIPKLIPEAGSDQRLPVLVTDNEIYVLLETGSVNSII